LADPQKILKRLSSLSLGERFRSEAGLTPSADDLDDDFGAG
jgi:hypothetical protein